jgi:Flp pilus assembly protein TadG
MTLASTLQEKFSALRARMRRDGRKGSAAIEFAIIAPVFFLFLMGVLEVGTMYVANSVLQKATDDAGRYIRTGQAQAASMTQDQFRTYLCGKISALLNCDSNLQIDVRDYSTSYSSANYSSPYGSDGNLDPTYNNYNTGTAGDVILVRVFYQWTPMTPLISPLLKNEANGKHLLAATAAFTNEPF